MQLHFGSASVDFADGYSFIPFVSPQLAVRGGNFTDEQISVLLHEVTHQLALKGPFGFLCVFLQSSRVLAMDIARLQAVGELGAEPRELSLEDVNIQAFEIFAKACGPTVASFAALIESYRYWLEGIAIFAQLDFHPSQTYETDSDLFSFVLALLNTDVLRTQPESSEEQAEGVTLIRGRRATVEDIAGAVQAARQSKFSGLLESLLTNPFPENAPYFIGYLLVRNIQKALAAKDSRLKDPELFYVLINSHLFFDKRLLTLCSPFDADYQSLVASFLNETVGNLLDVSVDRLKMIVDAIVDVRKSPVNFKHLDVASSLRSGNLEAWPDPRLEDVYESQMNAVFSHLLTQPRLSDAKTLMSDNVKTEVMRKVWHVTEVLFATMKFFKLRHTHVGILSCVKREEAANISWRSLGGSLTGLSEPITAEDASALIEAAQDAGAELETKGLFGDSLRARIQQEGFSALDGEIKRRREMGTLFIAEIYEVYSLLGQQRFRIMFRGKFATVMAYHWHEGGSPHAPSWPQDEQLLKGVRGYLSPSHYSELIDIPTELVRELGAIDSDALQDQVCRWWRKVFPRCRASDTEIRTVSEQKLSAIVMLPEDRELLRDLSRHALVARNQQRDAVTDQLNRRWLFLTGDLLIAGLADNESNIHFNL